MRVVLAGAMLCAVSWSALAQTTRTWVGVSGDWNIGSNWSPAGVPGALDSVIITTGGATLNSDASVASMTLGGALIGTGKLTVSSSLVWTGGSMSGTGSTIVAPGATMTIETGDVTLVAGRTLVNHGVASLSRAMNIWWPATLENSADGTLVISTNSDALGDAVRRASSVQNPYVDFKNFGLIVKSGDARSSIGKGITLTQSGSVEVEAGTFSTSADGTSTGVWTVDEAGTLETHGYLDFNGAGISGPGSLRLMGVHVFSAGTFHPDGPVTLFGNVTVNDAWSPDPGQLGLVKGTFIMNGALTIGDLAFKDCIWEQNGVLSASSLNIEGGSSSVNSDVTVASLTLTNIFALNGSGSVTVTDHGACSAVSSMAINSKLVVAPGATFDIAANTYVTVNGILKNEGVLNLAGYLYVNGNTPYGFSNAVGGIVNLTTDSESGNAAIGGEPSGIAENRGTIRKLGPKRSQIRDDSIGAVTFNNYGTINVLEGTLDVYASGEDGGLMTAAPGAVLVLSGSRTHLAGSAVSGAGTLRFEKRQFVSTPTNAFPSGTFGFSGALVMNGGNVTINDAFTPASLTFAGGSVVFGDSVNFSQAIEIGPGASVSFGKAQSFPALTVSGTLAGAGVVTVANALIVDGGTMSGSGTTVLMPACVSSFTSFALDKRTLENRGTATITGKCSMWNGAVFSNQAGANLTVSTDAATTGSAFAYNSSSVKVDNAGTLTKAGAVSTAMDSGVTCTNTGLIRVLAGKLTINSMSGPLGDISISPGASLTLGGQYSINKPLSVSAGGKLTLGGAWSNSSTVSSSGGSLSLSGNWSNSGTFDVSNSAWSIGGTYPTLGAHTGSGNQLTYAGTYPGTSLVADSSTGDITLATLTMNGATLLAGGGSRFITAANSVVTLNSCSLDGELAIQSCGGLTISGGLNLINGAVVRVRNNPCSRVAMTFTGASQTIGGTGRIDIDEVGSGAIVSVTTSPTVTIGPGVSMNFGVGPATSGNGSILVGSGRTLLNQGKISSILPGRTLTVSGGTLNNQGTLEAAAGNLTVSSVTNLTNYSSSAFSLTGGKWRAVGGSLALTPRKIRAVSAGTELEISGAANTTPDLSEWSANAGTVRIAGRTLAVTPSGGTLANSGTLEMGVGGLLNVGGGVNLVGTSVFRTLVGGLAASQFGSVAASGSVALGGNLGGGFVAPYVAAAADVIAGVFTSPLVEGSFAGVCFDSSPENLGVVAEIVAGSPSAVNLVVNSETGTLPSIVAQPQDSNARPNGTFEVGALPTSLVYQWRREGIALSDGPTGTGSTVAGSHAANLTIYQAGPTDAGMYDVVVTNACGSVVSDGAQLRICPSDLNNDGLVDDSDFVIFLAGYNILDCSDPGMAAGCPADLNSDGLVDDADFSIFVVAYDQLLCP